ncbi:MAG: bile acid germinant receptor pseudoprotease CspC [Peptostreptococcaceae bacterium]
MNLDRCYFVLYANDIISYFEEINLTNYIILNEQLAVVYVDENFNIDSFNKSENVISVIKTNPMNSLIQITNDLESGQSIEDASGIDYINNNPYINVDGKGVLIGILDSGIDYLNETFIYENGESKIVSIWDQSKPTSGNVKFGEEISNTMINDAIKNNDNILSIDEVGTGTIASSIVSNICTESNLIVVKLKRYKDIYEDEKISYNEGDFLAGIKYILDKAEELDLPLILNLTCGTMSGSVEELNLLDTFTELSKPRVFVVGGAGNEGNTGIHFEGKLEKVNDTLDVVIEVGKIRDLDILLEPRSIDKISVQLISPSGEISYIAYYKPQNIVYTGKFNTEDTNYLITYTYPDILSAKQKTMIRLEDAKPGVWTIRVISEFFMDGEFNLYLPNRALLDNETRFLDSNSISTTTTYSHGRNVITVGVYDDKTDSMWLSSSKGSKSAIYIKPDIVASGVDIISDFLNKTKNTSTGSGVSSSITTGVLSIIIEYLITQSEFTRLTLFTEVIKTYLMLGADKKDIYNYPNLSQGYGILNLQNTIKEIADNL